MLLALISVGYASGPALGVGGKTAAVAPASPQQCALLDDPSVVGRLDGLLLYLATACGRQAEFFGGVLQEVDLPAGSESPESADLPVSDPLQDTSGTARTQSETSIAYNPITGTLCVAWNDSFHGVTQGAGYSGFGRSIDGGATFTDIGAFPTMNYGDPSLAWRRLSGKFFYVALSETGLILYRSDTDCASFTEIDVISSTGHDDKAILAIDSTPGSPYNGRLYVAWTDYTDGRINLRWAANGGSTLSPAVDLSAAGAQVLGAWPAVAPNGDVYVAWLRWNPYPAGPIDIEMVKSTDGGTTFTPLPNPMTGRVNPRDAAATSSCGRPALKGNIRYAPFPTVVVDGAGVVHVVYSYDPDEAGSGDVVNVYYRRSTSGGTTWDPEVLINDDGTMTDQYQPSLSVGAGNVVNVGYYSRQLDTADNTLFDRYSRTSFDGGATFQASVRLSDASSPVVLDPNLASCYHGDYDTQTHVNGLVFGLWSNDLDPGCPGCGANPNVWTSPASAGNAFEIVVSAPSVRVCSSADAAYEIDVLQFQSFSEPVTLTASDNPAGTSVSFSENDLAPPYVSVLTVSSTEGAPDTSSTITVTGTSTPSLIERSGAVQLTIDGAAPAAPTLISPEDLTSGLPQHPLFSWAAVVGAVDYTLEVDDDADFSSPTYSATVLATSHLPPTPLPAGVVLYWRVRAGNSCGASDDSVVRRLAASAKSSFCRAPNLSIPDAQLAGVDDLLTVPAGAADITDLDIDLEVTHTFVADLSFSISHDGTQAVIIDRPGLPGTLTGCTRDDIDVRVDDEGIDGDIESQCDTDPAIGGDRVGGDPPSTTLLSAFDGASASGEWTLHVVDHAGADVGTVDSWCLVLAEPMPFLDGFESGDTLRWSSTVSGP